MNIPRDSSLTQRRVDECLRGGRNFNKNQMSLIIHDTLSLTTETGVSKIQLCIGDITKLPREEKVDVLVVSAFPGKLVTNTDKHAQLESTVYLAVDM